MSQNPNRRQFLRTGLAATAALVAAGPNALLKPAESFAENFPDLSIAYGRDPERITREAVEALGGMKRFVKPGNKVVIKPNMSFGRSIEAAANTHPAVVRAVARMCHEAGASKIAVLDNVLHSPRECFVMSKIPEFVEKVPDTVVRNVQAQRMFRTAQVPQGRHIKSMNVIAEVLDSDVLIAVPVGKHHSSADVSLSMKGMMGLIYDRQTFHRVGLHEAIVDMCSLLKPHLVVVDGTRILTAGGPSGSDDVGAIQKYVKPMNLVIASADMVAADAQMVALGIWGGKHRKPNEIEHIRVAAERGLGRIDLGNLNVKTIQV